MTDTRPHILFLLTDQQRADCLGCAGHPALRTPHVDRIASEGVRFGNCFTTSPLCVPARLSFANGLYPHNSNLWTNQVSLPQGAETYMRRLHSGGYRTATIGKNHLFPMENCDLYANEPAYHRAGFDHVEDLSGTWGVIGGKSVYTDHLESLQWLEPLRRYLRRLESLPDEVRRYVAEPLPIPPHLYIDAFIAERVEQYVARYDSRQPSFVFVGFQGPHEPWDAPDEYADRIVRAKLPRPIPELPPGDWLGPESNDYQKRWAQYYPPADDESLRQIRVRYLGKIAQIDDAVGRILSAYERKGWLKNTAIIFASDHGEMLGDLNRLSKSVFYESAIRVPLIVRMPTCVETDGRTCDAMVELIDVHATILDIAGCAPGPKCDSRSLISLIQGSPTSIRADVIAEAHVHYMLRTNRWKIVIGRDGQTLQMFNLADDPMEQRNLCRHPKCKADELELRRRMLTRLTQSTLRLGEVDAEFCGHSLPNRAA